MSNKKWHVVYSKPRWEKKIDEKLLTKGIESWCPLKKVEKQWSDRKKIIEEPIFRSYVFVKVDEAEKLNVLTTPGVLQFVFYNKKHAVIRDEEIEEIKNFLMLSDAKLDLMDASIFKEKSKVRVRRGVFIDKEGTVVRANKKKVYVLVESLGTVMVVEFKSDQLLKI